MSTIIIKGKSISEDELVKMNEIQKKPHLCKFHSLCDHNFYISRYGRCVYCMSGSKPIHRSLIGEDGDLVKVKK